MNKILVEKVKDTKNYSRYEVVSGGFMGHLYVPLDRNDVGHQYLLAFEDVKVQVAK